MRQPKVGVALVLTALLFDWFVGWNTEAEIKFVQWAQALLVLGIASAIVGEWLEVWLIAAGCLVGLSLLHLWAGRPKSSSKRRKYRKGCLFGGALFLRLVT